MYLFLPQHIVVLKKADQKPDQAHLDKKKQSDQEYSRNMPGGFTQKQENHNPQTQEHNRHF
jgi:hypothetical protein